ncbi:YhcU family protein [Anoxybacteroides tepidamans]|uniref:YhcU family protein n=1 Tax=Anoxybacteroides tepidamans TaxID=265948 RepID=UPI0004810A5C|nr:YhcU family protein [Anoxybacillus tepidamans]
MRIVYAATKEQEEYIENLIRYFYSHVFPRYFDDDQIKQFEYLQVLSLSNNDYNGTMREALQMISSLQSLLTIIECIEVNGVNEEYRHMFERNVRLLEQHGILFPFTIDQFQKKRPFIFSMYSPPSNDWVM